MPQNMMECYAYCSYMLYVKLNIIIYNTKHIHGWVSMYPPLTLSQHSKDT